MLLIPSSKKKSQRGAIQQLPDPKDLFLPLHAYRDTMAPVVSPGQRVKKYELLAESTGTFSARLHAPVSGTILGETLLEGLRVLHLENDFENEELPLFPVYPEALSLDDFGRLLRDHGVEGAGGSRFPTQIKYQLQGQSIRTIIFNGVECEPYLSADYAVMKEEAAQLMMAARLIRSVVAAERVVFAIERQNKELKKSLLESARKVGLEIEVKVLPNTYPQGGELQLIKSVTGLELIKGSIPSAHGILVNNIGTLRAIYQAIFEGKPYTERVLTVSGEKTARMGNHLVKIGTPVGHIIRETGNLWQPTEQLVILGGAMMGKAAESPLTPIHKGTGGVLLLTRKKTAGYNCIQCGVCVDVCPQYLMPLEFARHHSEGNMNALKELHLDDCIECGACAYGCPSDVPLMESIFAGKAALSQPPAPR